MKESKSAKLSSYEHQQDGNIFSRLFGKYVDPEASLDKDELGDALHWIRQATGLICGLAWGIVPLVGGIWFLLFLLLSSAIVYVYYAMILKVDEEDYGGHGVLLQEGLFASITLFLLAWILVYSLAHF